MWRDDIDFFFYNGTFCLRPLLHFANDHVRFYGNPFLAVVSAALCVFASYIVETDIKNSP